MKKQSWKKEFASLILNDSTEDQAMALKIENFPRQLFRFGKFDEKGFWEAPLLNTNYGFHRHAILMTHLIVNL